LDTIFTLKAVQNNNTAPVLK